MALKWIIPLEKMEMGPQVVVQGPVEVGKAAKGQDKGNPNIFVLFAGTKVMVRNKPILRKD